MQRAPGTRPSSHTTRLVPTPCPGGTPVSPAQGMWGISSAPLWFPGVVQDPSASLQALHPSWEPESHGPAESWGTAPSVGTWGAGVGDQAWGWAGQQLRDEHKE